MYVAGPELRTLPVETVTDATGARVRVPERKVADRGKLFWRTIPVPPELEQSQERLGFRQKMKVPFLRLGPAQQPTAIATPTRMPRAG